MNIPLKGTLTQEETHVTTLCQDALNLMMPLHLTVSASGHIEHVGPTLQKLRPDTPMVGQRLLELFEMRRPRDAISVEDIAKAERGKLHLSFRDGMRTSFKGLVTLLPNTGGLLINLSFGISVVDGVRHYNLSAGDFAATDLTVEMLYLVEAKSAALMESKKLNERLREAKTAAEERSVTDALTGLRNRRAMDQMLSRLLDTDQPFGLMHIDLDFFKDVNDTLGHAAGDHVLQVVGSILLEATRKDDLVARVGGDEFVVIFRSLRFPETLLTAARRTIEQLEKPIFFDGEICQISASAGIVVSTDYVAPTADHLLNDADRALYASKRAGRARATVYKPGTDLFESEDPSGEGAP